MDFPQPGMYSDWKSWAQALLTSLQAQGQNTDTLRQLLLEQEAAANASLASKMRHGECRLIFVSSTVVRLIPWNGDRIIVDGVERTIPAVGINLANTHAGFTTPTTDYLIYLRWNGSELELVPSTTAHEIGPDGIRVKIGDPSQTLVGRVRINSEKLFFHQQDIRWVISWFNRRPLSLWKALAADVVSSNTGFSEFLGTRVNFLTWNDMPPVLQHYGIWDLADTGAGAFTTYAIGYTDATPATSRGYAYAYDSATPSGNNFVPFAFGSEHDFIEGAHNAAIGAACSGGSYVLKMYSTTWGHTWG